MKSIVSPVPVEESTAAALSQSIHRLSRRLRKHAQMDLTASQVSVLTTVEKHGVLRLGELTGVEQVGKSTMTRLVAKLAEAGRYSSGSSTPATSRIPRFTDRSRGCRAAIRRGAPTRVPESSARCP